MTEKKTENVKEEKKTVSPEELLKMQTEVLKSASEYLPRLIEAATTVAEELMGKKEEDTREYFNQVISGINYIIESFNGTLDLTNKERIVFQTDEIEETVGKLSSAILEKNDEKIGTILQQEMIPFLQKYQAVIKDYI